jgi:hypothetical protein
MRNETIFVNHNLARCLGLLGTFVLEPFLLCINNTGSCHLCIPLKALQEAQVVIFTHPRHQGFVFDDLSVLMIDLHLILI